MKNEISCFIAIRSYTVPHLTLRLVVSPFIPKIKASVIKLNISYSPFLFLIAAELLYLFYL